MSYAIDPEVAAAMRNGPAETPFFAEYAASRAAESTIVENIPPYESPVPIEVRDVRLAAKEAGLRVYIPDTGADTTLPALIFIHGGGFVLGSVALSDRDARQIAAEVGTVVVSVDYRRAPEHRYPAAPEDCYAALEWLATNTDQLGVDPERIGVFGESAGGALAAAITMMSRDRGGPSLCFQYLADPVLDDRLDTPSMRAYDDTPVWNRPNAELGWDRYLGEGVRGSERVDGYAAPARMERLADLPPLFLTVNQFDPLRDEGICYAQRLAQQGIPTELRLYPGTFHGAVLFQQTEVARRMLADRLDALRRGLRADHYKDTTHS